MENKQNNRPVHDELEKLVRFELPEESAVVEDLEGTAFRREIRLILCALRDKAPYIYAFFRKASVEVFHIALDEDFQSPDRFEKMSIERFCKKYKSFRPKDCIFSLNFMTYCTEKERKKEYKASSVLECSPDGLYLYSVEEVDPDAAVEEILGTFPHFMLYLCRKAILANKPLVIDAETIEHYGLSHDDAAVVRKLVNKCNKTIVSELRTHYETLAAIDCLRTKDSDDGK